LLTRTGKGMLATLLMCSMGGTFWYPATCKKDFFPEPDWYKFEESAGLKSYSYAQICIGHVSPSESTITLIADSEIAQGHSLPPLKNVPGLCEIYRTGDYEITITAPGFQVWTARVHLSRYQTYTLNATLKKSSKHSKSIGPMGKDAVHSRYH
jgi:hypothetical protein